ncbi:MAG TPA: hypothetical protein VGY54_20745 [Polyangiaceae bacterium]|jgi:hypothetical protein|nr:hypothetical protein [Polyangiaceae bacterium]
MLLEQKQAETERAVPTNSGTQPLSEGLAVAYLKSAREMDFRKLHMMPSGLAGASNALVLTRARDARGQYVRGLAFLDAPAKPIAIPLVCIPSASCTRGRRCGCEGDVHLGSSLPGELDASYRASVYREADARAARESRGDPRRCHSLQIKNVSGKPVRTLARTLEERWMVDIRVSKYFQVIGLSPFRANNSKGLWRDPRIALGAVIKSGRKDGVNSVALVSVFARNTHVARKSYHRGAIYRDTDEKVGR